MNELDYDVVVVGMGVAGLSAALSAAEAGARVGVLERAPEGEHGGNTRYTEAFLRMKSVDEVSEDFEDRFANESGYHVDPGILSEAAVDRAKRSNIARASGSLAPDVVATFSEEAGPTLEWMQGAGVKFAQASTPFITTATTRFAPVGGGLAIVETLTEACRTIGVTFHFEHTAQSLTVDDSGRVDGVVASVGRQKVRVKAGAVILASGGFEGNPEMISQYIPLGSLARPVARGGYYNRGEGIRMALDVGAASSGDFNLFHAEPIDPRSAQAEPAVFAFGYGVLVNANGERFTDESAGTSDATYEAVTRKILQQPGGIAYALFDAKLANVPNHQSALRTDQPAISASSLSEMAEKLSVPAETLAATIEGYNSACGEGEFSPLTLDGLSTSGLTPPKSNWACTIDEAPFLAYPVAAANVFTFGGLKVDATANVVDSDGEAIAGLFAAGETMGTYYGTYIGSTSVLKGAVFGRIAGLTAAKGSRSDAQQLSGN